MNKRTLFSLGVVSLLVMACGGTVNGQPSATPGPNGRGAESGSSEPVAASGGSGEAPAGTELSELEAKRLVESIKETLPPQVERLTSMCGATVTIEVDWSSVGREKEALENLWSNYGASRIVSGFDGVCADKSGKDAVKSKIKKVKLVNTRDRAKVGIALSGGELVATMNWSSGGDPGPNEHEIAAAITKQL